mgnify:CR=1 FL=1
MFVALTPTPKMLARGIIAGAGLISRGTLAMIIGVRFARIYTRRLGSFSERQQVSSLLLPTLSPHHLYYRLR